MHSKSRKEWQSDYSYSLEQNTLQCEFIMGLWSRAHNQHFTQSAIVTQRHLLQEILSLV